MALPPMISAKSLGLMPQLVLEKIGSRSLDTAMAISGLPHQFVDHRDGYIPKRALADFVSEVGRGLGERNVGLLWAPNLSVLDYDAWGRYVLSASTLGAALERARRIMPYHSSTDSTGFRFDRDLVCYEYRFGLTGHPAYPDIAFSALGSMLSIFRHYHVADWCPVRIHCDFPPVELADDAEITFRCPVHWNAGHLGICFHRDALGVRAERSTERIATIEELRRERATGTPRVLVEIVSSVLRLQIKASGISLDKTAQALDLGPRSLQRRLREEGTTFRSLTNQVVVGRAKELLKHGGMSIRDIAMELGYDCPQNFARAFKNITGVSPTQFAALKSISEHRSSL
ncbi:AraC family transcriptional regulator ligand-binding domain-containing protein [Tropicimonas sp. TH_r6]|uniref:AraC family transcriptional regulator ligand-binding domain-containing protein n=1 Tax=Tropicimonas sp. TH_r6 TaxID=3082085 RepID=UPI0029541C6C|nr:AraC family transcriptional regulator ligand-binding domain-containing protein [Tropicimonas sp. TH_r6]MDV7145813.1 AraC family transcriptional regulator ligand-binding domain-containing protein [Tropicimonas sp. TH_r6]